MSCRSVLSTHSNVLCDMLSIASDTFPLPDCSLDTAVRCLTFIYEGNAPALLPMQLERVPDVMRFYDKYDMYGALELYDELLASRVTEKGDSPTLWVWPL